MNYGFENASEDANDNPDAESDFPWESESERPTDEPDQQGCAEERNYAGGKNREDSNKKSKHFGDLLPIGERLKWRSRP